MSRRLPVIPTAVVLLAVGVMIALGFWQLGRAQERDAAKAQMVAQFGLPATAYPFGRPTDQSLLFRRLTAPCDRVSSWETRGGEGIDGRSGWRHIATCVSGEGTLEVDMGVSPEPGGRPEWTGGQVTGHAVRAPDTSTLGDRLLRRQAPRRLMIVAEEPARGLVASQQPDPADETNSSWSYAIQWFFFALTALAIYALALRKKWRSED